MPVIGIVYNQDIRYCPYLTRYTEQLCAEKIPYECIWWERWDEQPDTPLPEAVRMAEDCHVFCQPSKMARNPLLKIGDFAAFGRFARSWIQKKRYDRLIILTTMTGMVLADLLKNEYRNRFIFDIRDYSYEKLPPYRWMEKSVIAASAFTSISSEGFCAFLPKGFAYVRADNFLDADIEAARGVRFEKKSADEPIVLSYMGFIRYFSQNRKILDLLADDPRYLLRYHGLGADYEDLLTYQEIHKMKNLQITGFFDHLQDKKALCLDADMINNFYPHTLEIQRLATTNKMYDGMIYRRPQLVSRHTYSETLVTRWQIGCALDIDQPDFADRLYAYYQQLDADQFNENAQRALAEVIAQDQLFRQRIQMFLQARDDGKREMDA